MKLYYFGPMALMLILALACQSELKTPPPAPGGEEEPLSLPKVTVMNRIVPEDIRQDPFTLTKVEMPDQHILALEVSYSGGCQKHRFDLYFTTFFDTSTPEHVAALLAHNDHNDPCDSWQQQTLYFDLSPLAEAYRSHTGKTSGRLVIAFPDAKYEEQEIIYQF